jgi:hypothetical protein
MFGNAGCCHHRSAYCITWPSMRAACCSLKRRESSTASACTDLPASGAERGHSVKEQTSAGKTTDWAYALQTDVMVLAKLQGEMETASSGHACTHGHAAENTKWYKAALLAKHIFRPRLPPGQITARMDFSWLSPSVSYFSLCVLCHQHVLEP